MAPPDYTGVTIWVAPHPDDEGGLWADELNTGATSFPVFVFLTNGENAGACTDDASLQAAPAGNLASGDRPPFNTAGDLPGAPEGYLGAGLPPEADGAQGDNPPVFPADPPLSKTTGWQPLESAASVSGTGGNGQRYVEGFAGPCRAARLAATTSMFSRLNRVVRGLSPTADRAFFPSVAAGAPPDGQQCYPAPMNEVYASGPGRYSTPQGSGEWTGAATPPGVTSSKDPCAYFWLTPTGDVFAFNLGDLSSGFTTQCPVNLGGRLHTGARWPAGSDGYDSIGDYGPGARPGDGICPAALPSSEEAYGVTPSDVLWAVQQVLASGRLPSDLPVRALKSAGWASGFNPLRAGFSGVGGIDAGQNTAVTSCAYLTAGGSTCSPDAAPAGTCDHYLSSAHLAAGLALQWNTPAPGVPSGVAVCAGDPLAARTFGTTDPADGIRFWTQVFNYDGGSGWEAADEAYGWLTGPVGFDPYGNVADTCPGSKAVARVGQSQWSCQESLTVSAAPGPTTPGPNVVGMFNVYSGLAGEGLTPGL